MLANEPASHAAASRLHSSSEAPASLSPSSTSIPRSPSIDVDAVTPDIEYAHALWLSSNSSAESGGAESSSAASSGAERPETSGGEASESLPQILESATATDMEASVLVRRPRLPRPASQPIMPGGQLIAPPQRRSTQQGRSAVSSFSPSSSSLESIGEDDSCVHPSHQTAPVRLTERSMQQGCSAALSLSPSSSSLKSIGKDDSCVHPSHQTSPVRLTERGTAVAAARFLELLRALDPSTGNLTTAQLTKGVTPRAAPAKTEHLRSRTPARPEALHAPDAAPADSAGAPAKPEAQRDRPRSMLAEQHSAHTTEMDQHSAHITEMMLLHHMRQTNNVRQRSTSGELRGAGYTPAWSPGAGRSRARAKTLDCFEGM